MKSLLSSIITLACSVFVCTSCTDMEDDGSRAFADVATIMGDSENGYYCHLDHGGLAVSYSEELAGKERGYFTFSYTESDWTIGANGVQHIDNVHVRTIETYDVVHPLTREEAASGHITDKGHCTVPERLAVGYVSGGYVDLSAGFATFNHESGEIKKGEVNVVYDAARQEPDTLRLQLCYSPRIPDGWKKTSSEWRTVSCDISSFSSLLQWKDSLTLVIENGSKEKRHLRKMSRNDFLKPGTGRK